MRQLNLALFPPIRYAIHFTPRRRASLSASGSFGGFLYATGRMGLMRDGLALRLLVVRLSFIFRCQTVRGSALAVESTDQTEGKCGRGGKCGTPSPHHLSRIHFCRSERRTRQPYRQCQLTEMPRERSRITSRSTVA